MIQVVISFDFELGWGVLETQAWRRRESSGVYQRLRLVMPELLSLLKQYELPTTWAMVSNMLIANIKNLSIEHLPENYRNNLLTFFHEAKEDTRLGLDLVDQVMECNDLCEIASHSSSHIYANQASVTEDQYIADIMLSFEELENFTGRSINTLVFPRDQEKFRFGLAAKKTGLVMRLNPNFAVQRSTMQRGMHALGDFIRPLSESDSYIGRDGECYQMGSFNFNTIGGKYHKIRELLLREKLRKLYQAIENSSSDLASTKIYHIWLHPFNLSESSLNQQMFNTMLHRLSEYRDQGKLQIMTMQRLAADCQLTLDFKEA